MYTVTKLVINVHYVKKGSTSTCNLNGTRIRDAKEAKCYCFIVIIVNNKFHG